MPQKYFQITIVAAISPVPGMWVVPADMSLRKTNMFTSDPRQMIPVYFLFQRQQKQVRFVNGVTCCGLSPCPNEMWAFSKGHFCDLQIPSKAGTRGRQASHLELKIQGKKNSLGHASADPGLARR